ncbi:hypothetical protein OG21DRAFT_1486025 [Imleria badia]|nr:hypothetical protein OG21DRAFT_1486025 [Imleria badia]
MALSDATHNSLTTLHTMGSSLDKLIDDILIQIFQTLSVHAVLSLRKTSRRYYLLSKLRCVWYARFCVEVLARNLPLPGPPHSLSLLSATELEQRTLRALYLERAWPRLSANTLVSRYHHHGAGARVDQVVFIPGGTELLTVQGDTVVHWLIVSWPGFTQGLKHVGEWTPFEGVPCRIVKDVDVPGVIAVGPREPLGFERSAKVLSTSLKAPFVTLCDYARVPGVVAGVWRHFLLLNTTRELQVGEGGLELLDWHAQTTGTALLPRLPELFGSFLDFAVFAGHFVVVWEHCMSIFPVPRVPANGQVLVEHTRVFMFQETISRPVGFTTCVPRRVVPSCLNPNANLDRDAVDWNWDGQRKQDQAAALGMLPTLTIAARSRRLESVSMLMLIPLEDEVSRGRRKTATAETNTFPYRLAYLPPHVPSILLHWGNQEAVGGLDDYVSGACTTLCLGSSGRGVFVVGRELRLMSPGLLILPPYDMQVGPVFETGKALYFMDQHRKRDLNRLRLDGNVYGANEESGSGDRVDFDEGMGRFVVAKERGGFEVVQLD